MDNEPLVGDVVRLIDFPELNAFSETINSPAMRWTDFVYVEQVPFFVAEINDAFLTSCFIPIQRSSRRLFLDQTYPDVRNFYNIKPIIDYEAQSFNFSPIETSQMNGTFILIGGSPERNWYHWLLNWLPRLLVFIKLSKGINKFPNAKFIFHYSVADEPYWSTVEALGINKEQSIFIDPDRDMHFEKLLIPTFGNPNFYYPEIIKLLRQNTPIKLDHNNNCYPKRLFISREAFDIPKRRIVNIEFLKRVFDEFNVSIVELTGMRGSEQLALFANCELVIGVHGAGLANIAMCKDGTNVVILDNERNISLGLVGMFSALSDILRLNYKVTKVNEVLIEGINYSEFGNLHNRDVIVDPAELSKLLGGLMKQDISGNQAELGTTLGLSDSRKRGWRLWPFGRWPRRRR